MADDINEARLARWNQYFELLKPLADAGKIELQTIPEGCVHNAHMFWLKTADEKECAALREFLKEYDILPLADAGKIELQTIPEGCVHNAHMFWLKTADEKECAALREFLKEYDILAVSHYVPLHSAPAGVKYGRFCGEDRYTTKESERLLRLPMYYGLTEEEAAFVAEKVKEFYGA